MYINYSSFPASGLQSMPLTELEMRRFMQKDSSTCCRLAKAKASGLSDSMESVESNASKRSHTSSITSVKKSPKPQNPPAKRPKSSNDEVVCTPDLLSMLEPDCQISVTPKLAARNPITSPNISTTPRIVTVQQNYSGPSPSGSSSNGNPPAPQRSSLPPPLVLSSSGMRYRQAAPSPIVRRTVVPNALRSAGPVFHTINGFRVDLNSAAQQDSYRLPNGRLIQVNTMMRFKVFLIANQTLPYSGKASSATSHTTLDVSLTRTGSDKSAGYHPSTASSGTTTTTYGPQ